MKEQPEVGKRLNKVQIELLVEAWARESKSHVLLKLLPTYHHPLPPYCNTQFMVLIITILFSRLEIPKCQKLTNCIFSIPIVSLYSWCPVIGLQQVVELSLGETEWSLGRWKQCGIAEKAWAFQSDKPGGPSSGLTTWTHPRSGLLGRPPTVSPPPGADKGETAEFQIHGWRVGRGPWSSCWL